jgi:hypothetical protein
MEHSVATLNITPSTRLEEMSSPDTAWCWVAKLSHTIMMYQEDVNQHNIKVRAHDKATPFAVHPIWCAISILSAPDLNQDLRVDGFWIILNHNLENYTGKKPDCSQVILEKIHSLQCLSYVKEADGAITWSAPPEIRLFKLFEQVHKLYDNEHECDDIELDLTQDLLADVQTNYGNLKIVRIAKALMAK